MAKSKKPVVTNDAEVQLARALADYQNLAKRFEKEKLEVILRANKNLLEDLLPVIEGIENAQAHLNDQGLKISVDQLYNVLDRYGIEPIAPQKGEEFNSLIHEAVDSVDGGKYATISQLYAKGYKWKQEPTIILRPAKVIVYNGKQSS